MTRTAPLLTPTREYLCSLFNYDEWTGDITWAVRKSGRASIGSPAGHTRHGYLIIKIDGVSYQASRLIYKMMMDEEPGECVDHMNNNKLDNRWCNLRSCTVAENQLNRIDTKLNGGFYYSFKYETPEQREVRLAKMRQRWHERYKKS